MNIHVLLRVAEAILGGLSESNNLLIEKILASHVIHQANLIKLKTLVLPRYFMRRMAEELAQAARQERQEIGA
jgi:hypothetical protein